MSVFVPRAREGISATTLNPTPIPPVCPTYIISSELPKVYIGLKPELNIDALQGNILLSCTNSSKTSAKSKGASSVKQWPHFFITYRYVLEIYSRAGVETSPFAEDGIFYTSNRNTNIALNNLQRDRKLK